MRFQTLLWAVFLVFSTQACSIYEFVDSPGNDEDILSRARGCFDRGDYDCALEEYAKLSDAYANIKNSEQALVLLARVGIDTGDILEAFSSGDGGPGLTELANKLIGTVDATDRQNIHTAYTYIANITDDTTTRGFIQFSAAITMAAAVLAENAAGSTFETSDLTTTPTACENGPPTTGNCPQASNDLGPETDTTVPFGSDVDNIATTFTDNGANLGVVHNAIARAYEGLQAIGVGSSFGGASNFAEAISTGAAPTDANNAAVFRNLLLSEGLGTTSNN